MKSFPSLRPLAGLLSSTPKFAAANQARWLHKSKPAAAIPKPIPFAPDVETFLTLIGRGLNKHASKFPSWESLFSSGQQQFQELGIEPASKRRYLMRFMDVYRKSPQKLGPGSDFEFVHEGKALLKIAVPTAAKSTDTKWVVNVPSEDAAPETAPKTLVRPRGYKVTGLDQIGGSYAEALPNGAGAVVKVREGMWQINEGRKVDGGERRRAEIQFKKRSAERRAEREAALMAKL
jgi:hypothetical protein